VSLRARGTRWETHAAQSKIVFARVPSGAGRASYAKRPSAYDLPSAPLARAAVRPGVCGATRRATSTYPPESPPAHRESRTAPPTWPAARPSLAFGSSVCVRSPRIPSAALLAVAWGVSMLPISHAGRAPAVGRRGLLPGMSVGRVGGRWVAHLSRCWPRVERRMVRGEERRPGRHQALAAS
jgi:hypothetical protein